MPINILAKAPKAPTTFKKFGKLPGKPSELIRLALADLKAAEKAKVKINMGRWVATEKKGDKQVCTVCMAGAVMAKRFKDEPMVCNVLSGKERDGSDPYYYDFRTNQLVAEVEPDDLTDGSTEALHAINNFREGDIAYAFDALGLTLPESFVEHVDIIDYHRNRMKFKEQMAELASALAKQGY